MIPAIKKNLYTNTKAEVRSGLKRSLEFLIHTLIIFFLVNLPLNLGVTLALWKEERAMAHHGYDDVAVQGFKVGMHGIIISGVVTSFWLSVR